MHVVFVSRMPPATCGIAEYTSMLLSELGRIPSLKVLVLGGDVNYPLGSEFEDPYTGMKAKNCFVAGDLSYLQYCIDSLDVKPQIVHIQHELGVFPSTSALVSFMKNLYSRRIKVVLTSHTVIHSLGGKNLVSMQKMLIKNSNAVVVHSVLQEQELFKQGVPYRKVYLIPHGTLINPYINKPKDELLSELPLPLNLLTKKIICIAGFVRSRDKDYVPIIKAVNKLSNKYDIGLVVAGMPRRKNEKDLSLERMLKRVAERSRNIHYIEGFLERSTLLKLLAASDIIAIPIVDRRKYPLSVSGIFHLAIGSGKPVLCTRTHKLVECNMIAPELTLRVFTVEEVVEKIKMILEGGREVKRAIEKLWNYALETRWEIIARKHKDLYEELVSGYKK